MTLLVFLLGCIVGYLLSCYVNFVRYSMERWEG